MIVDWDDAYANGPHIEGADDYPGIWQKRAKAFRDELGARARLDIAYGEGERQRLDLFLPAGTTAGLAMFVHGGYWKAFDKSTWSHLARGAVESGWAVAMPSYTLAPEARIAGITEEIARALGVASEMVAGPVCLAGHSAGGHLVSRMLCRNAPLGETLRARIGNVVSISGLHDLRPLLRLEMNRILGLDDAEAVMESPALQYPAEGARLTCWVGSEERPEFLRQNDLLANIWTGLGAETSAVHALGKHHFDVIADLEDANSALTRLLTGERN
ncbi:alpha/beta hydrolase [Nisaea acidiphila]|uniref:Alpha/beta hydrolase n=2 Tax=Nisaea acidiphila TaxID=1862145 RepID=A0A9J7B3P2_9PROT|nr:alpha/beta hydrolase [Nisaea acidiphila]